MCTISRALPPIWWCWRWPHACSVVLHQGISSACMVPLTGPGKVHVTCATAPHPLHLQLTPACMNVRVCLCTCTCMTRPALTLCLQPRWKRRCLLACASRCGAVVPGSMHACAYRINHCAATATDARVLAHTAFSDIIACMQHTACSDAAAARAPACRCAWWCPRCRQAG